MLGRMSLRYCCSEVVMGDIFPVERRLIFVPSIVNLMGLYSGMHDSKFVP